MTVTQEELTQRFGELLKQALASGDEVVVLSATGSPVARVVPVPQAPPVRRRPGSAAGQIVIGPDFNDPLPDDVLDDFYK
jgi:antitoxin (DNA-binding transcriptional repressor) of toxin-antitoxin stability system